MPYSCSSLPIISSIFSMNYWRFQFKKWRYCPSRFSSSSLAAYSPICRQVANSVISSLQSCSYGCASMSSSLQLRHCWLAEATICCSCSNVRVRISSYLARQSFFSYNATSCARICDSKPYSCGRLSCLRSRQLLTAWSNLCSSSSRKDDSLSVTCLRWVTVRPTMLRNYRLIYYKHPTTSTSANEAVCNRFECKSLQVLICMGGCGHLR